MKKLNSIILISVLSLTVGCGSRSGDSSPQGAPTPNQNKNTQQSKFEGIAPSPATQMADLPNGSFIQLRATIEIVSERLSKYPHKNSAVAFFQDRGVHGFGPGSDGWMKYRNPYIDTRGKVCTIEIDLVKFDALSKSQPSLMLSEDNQIQLKDKVVAGSPETTKGTVGMTALETDGLLKKLGCDHLTVREVEQDIFGGKIEILVPKH